MEVVHEKPVTRVYYHRINDRLLIPLVVSLMIGGFTFKLLENFARFQASWFVRAEERKGKNDHPYTAFVVRDAGGAESSLPTGLEPAGLQPGDLVIKGPGHFTYYRLPAGSPVPEARWFLYGTGDLPRAIGILTFLSLVVTGTALSLWRRWSFDRSTGFARRELPLFFGWWVSTGAVPLADIRGATVTPVKARTNGLFVVTMQTAGRSYELAKTIYPDQAVEALAPLADVLPVKRLDSNA